MELQRVKGTGTTSAKGDNKSIFFITTSDRNEVSEGVIFEQRKCKLGVMGFRRILKINNLSDSRQDIACYARRSAAKL